MSQLQKIAKEHLKERLKLEVNSQEPIQDTLKRILDYTHKEFPTKSRVEQRMILVWHGLIGNYLYKGRKGHILRSQENTLKMVNKLIKGNTPA